ncbi:MAG: hypothetical protein IJA25_03205 [Anaerotignum sp.]|nr:hypothetical protein [Anaerotignum sp.]
MPMTRGRDVFWGILAAVLPLVSIMVYGNIERRLEQYAAHTFNQIAVYPVFALMFVLMGVALFALAVRFGSKPVETSRVPLIGLVAGWVISMGILIFFFLPYFLEASLKISGYLWTYGSREDFLFAGYYTALLVWYWKTHTFLSKEELQKKIEA